jgi:hypothetical protein
MEVTNTPFGRLRRFTLYFNAPGGDAGTHWKLS